MNNDVAERVKIITLLFTAFGQGGDKERIALYCKKLEAVPPASLAKICDSVMLTARFVPTIAELVEAAKSLAGTVDPDKRELLWAEAWQEIWRGVANTPYTSPAPKWSTPEIAATVNAFGWLRLHEVLSSEMEVVEAHMRSMYLSFCKKFADEERNKAILNGNGNMLGVRSAAKLLQEMDKDETETETVSVDGQAMCYNKRTGELKALDAKQIKEAIKNEKTNSNAESFKALKRIWQN